MPVVTEGLQSGTLANNLVLSEYINSSGGQIGYNPQVLVSTNVGASIELQLRNAANNANVWAHRMFVLAASPCIVLPAPSAFVMEASERMRVVLITGLLGNVQATMFT